MSNPNVVQIRTYTRADGTFRASYAGCQVDRAESARLAAEFVAREAFKKNFDHMDQVTDTLFEIHLRPIEESSHLFDAFSDAQLIAEVQRRNLVVPECKARGGA